MTAHPLRSTLAALVLLTAVAAHADDAKPTEPGPWKFGAVAGLNLSQSTFSSNWAGGDKGSIVWVLNADLTAARQISHAFNLANDLQLAYGQTARQLPDANGHLSWSTPDKTTDLIAFQSTGRLTLQRLVDPYVGLKAETQFKDQSSAFGTITFNPVKLKESAGIARVLWKNADSEGLSRVGFGFRQTLAKSFVPSTLVKHSFTANDGGIEWQTDIARPLLQKKVLYKAQLLVYRAVFYSKSDALSAFDASAIAADPGRRAVAGFWESPDVNFQNTFTAAITKVLSVNLYAQLVYDKFDSAADVDPALSLSDQIVEIDRNVRRSGQYKETLALGLSYRLF